MNMYFVSLLCGSLLMNSLVIPGEVSNPREISQPVITSSYFSSLKKHFNDFLTLGGAACTAAVGFSIGKWTVNSVIAEDNICAPYREKAEELLCKWCYDLSQSLPQASMMGDGIMSYSHQFRETAISLMPSDHEYFKVLRSMPPGLEYTYAATFTVSILLLGAAWIMVDSYFNGKSEDTEADDFELITVADTLAPKVL